MQLISDFLTKFPLDKSAIKFLTKLNTAVYRLSRGRLLNKVDGTPVCLVTMTGAKSGLNKTIPLMYNPHGEQVLLVASLRGSDRHPLWYFNLKANPEIEIQIGEEKRQMKAHLASKEEKAQVWPLLVENFRSYGDYAKKTERDIPVFICSPV